MNSDILKEINEIIKKHNSFLVTSHMDPDGDSIGSQMAVYYYLMSLGKEVIVLDEGAMPAKYRFLDPHNIIRFSADKEAISPEVIVVLECPSLDRTGYVKNLIPESSVIINIDHHNESEYYGHINLVDKDSAAVAEILYYLFEAGEGEITPEIAGYLYAALSSDTGRFRFGSTTARCMFVASKLIEKGADPKGIADHLYSGILANTIKLLGITLASLKTVSDGRIGYFTIRQENLRQTGAELSNSEGFVDFILSISGVMLGFLFKEIDEDNVKVSVRSQNGFDSSLFASKYNGGGHTNAAGFSIPGKIENVVNEVISKAAEYIDERD